MFPKLVEITPLEKFKLRLNFSDGIRGEIDLSYLENKGVFKHWSIKDNFYNVQIDDETGSIKWNENIELCPDSMYLKLIGKTFEQYKNEFVLNASN